MNVKQVNLIIDRHGNKRYFNEFGLLHRENDLPAIEYASGGVEYYKDGQLHRDNDLPARISYVCNEIHVQEWMINNQLHREGNPAVIFSTGSQVFYKHGKRHNLKGSAEIWVQDDGQIEINYCVEGEYINSIAFKIKKIKNKIKKSLKP